MKISYNWLKEILEFNLDSDQTSALLTDIGLEVEREEVYENIKGGLQGLIVGEVKSVEKHPNACLLYTSPSPRDATLSRMPSSA